MRRKGFEDVFDEMQNLLGEFQDMGRDFTGMGAAVPVDVREEDGEIVVTADLPGMTKEDISLKADKEKIEISAESTEEISEHNEKYFKRERSSRSFRRAVAWPASIEPESIKAKYDNGVLEVRAQKAEDAGIDVDIE